MKKTLAALAAIMMMTVASYGQGAVSFNTKVGADPDIKVARADGTGAGAGYTAQLWLVNGTSLTALTPTTTFRTTTAAAAYYVSPIDLTVPGAAVGSVVTMRLRAFNGADYASSSIRGESANFTVTLGGDTLPPGNLSSVQTVTLVPEPSMIALGVLGLGALMIRRRK